MRDREYWLDLLAETEPEKLDPVYEDAIRVCPHEKIWTLYAKYLLDKGTAAKEALEHGNRAVGCWLDSSHKFWSVYLQFLQSHFPEVVFDAYLARLTVPHLALDETFQAFSEYVSASRPTEYEQILSAASLDVAKTKKLLARRESWELRLNSSPQVRFEILSDYLEWELKSYQPNSKFDFCNPLFERILTEFPNHPAIWQKYIWHNWVDRVPMSKIQQPFGAPESSRADVQTIFDRALEFCPGSAALAASQMRWAQMNGSFDVVLTTKVHADENSLAGDEQVWLQYVSGLYQGLIQELIDKEQFLENVNDGLQHGSVKLMLLAATLLEKIDARAAKALWVSNVSKFCKQPDFWKQWLVWQQQRDTFEVAKVISSYRACQKEHGVHFPEFEEDITFYWQCENQPQAIEKAVSIQAVSRPLPVPKRSADEMDVDEESVPVAKKVVQETAPSRNREHSSVIVVGASEDVLRSLLKNIVGVTDTNGVLLVEFESPRDKLVAISILKYEGHKSNIKAYSADDTTVWVNNFPAEWLQGDIERKFGQFGKVLAVRMPSRKTNSKRRFCYVQFDTAVAAHSAVEALDGVDECEVKISDPDQRSKRPLPSDNGREVFVRGFPFDQPINSIKTFLQSECNPESIRIPPGKHNKPNAGYAFMTFSSSQEAGRAAEQLHDREFVGRRLLASISEPQKGGAAKSSSKSSAPAPEARPRTLSVSNLSQTVNDAQLKTVFSEFGEVESVHLDSKAASASVVYSSVRDAGKAVLALNGRDVEGKPIEVEFFKPAKPSMFRPRRMS